jgi:hypothetical protein
MIKYLNAVIKPYIQNNEKQILFLDNFEAHKTDSVLEECRKLKLDVVFIPPGFTSSLQPLDVSVNKPFKDYYKAVWNEWMSSKQAVYTKAGNRQKPAYQDLVDMVSESLKNIDNRKNIIKTSFTTTGILNSRIGQFNQRLKNIIVNEDNWETEIYFHNKMNAPIVDHIVGANLNRFNTFNILISGNNDENDVDNVMHLVLSDNDDDGYDNVMNLVLSDNDDV